MINQLAVNPATETYCFTQMLGIPTFSGSEVSAAVANHLRLSQLNDQLDAAGLILSEAGFYFSNDTEITLQQLRRSLKNLIDTDQVLKTALLQATGFITIKTTQASSKDSASQSLTMALYTGGNDVTGGTLLFTETRVKAVNSFVASGTKVLSLNGLPVA